MSVPFVLRPFRDIVRAPALLVVLLAASAWLAPAAVAQDKGTDLGFGDFGADPGNPVHVSVRGPEEPVPAGGRFEVVLDVTVDEPYHIYAHDSPGVSGLPTEIAGEASEGIRFETTVQPDKAAHAYHDEILDEDFLLLDGDFSFRGVFTVDEDRAPGPAEASLSIVYMACDDQGCLLPQEETYTVPLDVRAPTEAERGAPPADPVGGSGTGAPDGVSSEAAPSGSPGGREGSLESRLSGALSSGNVGLLLWLALVFGFVSLLTPCVFPMIPITVSFFSKRSEQAGGKGARFALAYGLGIVATYTGFGMAMATVLGAGSLQAFATNPFANLAIGALFVFFGLSLMGFYDLKPPAFLVKRAEGGAAARPGYAPVFVMGFVFTITAFTCTAPIVGSLLAALATGGSPWLIAAGMLVYSAAFALPFVLLALFPSAVSKLPGAGGWMVTLKVMLGFLEVVAALKFFSNADLVWNLQIMPRPVMLMATVMTVAALALYLLGTYRLPHDMPGKLRLFSWRMLGAGAIVLATLYLSSGLTGKELDPWTESYLPPHDYAVPEGSFAGPRDPIDWFEDYEEGLAEGRRTGRRIFIDFTGITCVNCRKVEKQFFSQPAFIEAAKGVVMLKLTTDRRDAEHKQGDLANQELMASFGSVTLPLYVLLSPDGEVLDRMGYSPDFTTDDFVEFMEGPDR
ncbi:MAG: protein-disulfide reductase DsbD family protein [Planctomycetota bacterium]